MAPEVNDTETETETVQAGQRTVPSASEPSKRRLNRRDVLLLGLAVAIVAAISLGALLYRDRVEDLSAAGYLGILLANAIGSATIVLPVPGIATVIIGATTWNPVLVGIAGGTGSTIGEFTAYIAGASARSSVDRIMADSKWYSRSERWMRRHGFLTVFLLAATPNPFMDFAGLASGSLGYSAKRFIVACLLGKLMKYVPVALASYWGAEAVLRFFD